MSIDPTWLQQNFPDLSNIKDIGRGGQKSVFFAKSSVNQDIVLKICHLGIDPERIEREIDAVKRIESPRVPKIIDIGTKTSSQGPVIWLIEEYIPGDTLRIKLNTTILTSTDILRIGLHILEALAIAEQSRIVHRDIKPDNIIIDPCGNAWLLDFGLARHLDMDSLTASASAYGVGTPGYSPPEQFRNRKTEIDSRTDLFGLGITLYECIEGINPFRDQARDIDEIYRRIEGKSLPTISKTIDKKSKTSDLILSLTRIRRDHRPASAAEALEWIQEICLGECIL
jgi:eukaryotic-like serine/threonine-protein kinase